MLHAIPGFILNTSDKELFSDSEVPFVPMSNLFFLVGTTIGERLLYPLTVGWALVLAGLGVQSHGTRGGCIKLASMGLLVPWLCDGCWRSSSWNVVAAVLSRTTDMKW